MTMAPAIQPFCFGGSAASSYIGVSSIAECLDDIKISITPRGLAFREEVVGITQLPMRMHTYFRKGELAVSSCFIKASSLTGLAADDRGLGETWRVYNWWFHEQVKG